MTMRYLLLALLAACSPALPAQPLASAAPSGSPVAVLPSLLPSAPASPLSPEQEELRMAALVNQERFVRQLPKLRYNLDLARIARDYSARMIRDDFFDHADRDGLTVGARLKQAGQTFQKVGENLAVAPTVEIAQQKFLDSATHRGVMLFESFVEIGIGIQPIQPGQRFTEGGASEPLPAGDLVITQIYRLPKSE